MWLAFCELQSDVILIIKIWMANAKIAGLVPNKDDPGKGQLLRSQSRFIPPLCVFEPSTQPEFALGRLCLWFVPISRDEKHLEVDYALNTLACYRIHKRNALWFRRCTWINFAYFPTIIPEKIAILEGELYLSH